MDDDDRNNTILIGWILGIGVALSMTVALLTGAIGLHAGTEASAAPGAAPVFETRAPGGVSVVGKVYFKSGMTTLPADAAAALQPVIDAVRARSDARISVSGYHDKTGNPEQNAELAKQRAVAVRDALVAAGVADTRIELRKPEATQGDGSNREARHVEARVE